MSLRRLTFWLCLAMIQFGGWAHAAEPAAGKKKPEEITRYIFIIDNSAVLKSELETIRKTVAYLIYNGFYGRMNQGDPIEVWTFNDTVKANLVPVQYWNLELHNMLASQNYEILKNLRFEKAARMDRLMDTLQIAIHRADSLVIFLISAGEEVVVGSPVDRKINVAYGLRYEDLLTEKKPFLTTLVSKRGRFTAWAVTAGDEKVELNPIEYPGEPSATPPTEKNGDKPAPSSPTVAVKEAVPPVPSPSIGPAPPRPTPKPAVATEVPPSRPKPVETVTATTPDPVKVSPPPTRSVAEPVAVTAPKPTPPPPPLETKPAPIETKVAKIEEPKVQTPVAQPVPVPPTAAAPAELPKPIPTPPAAKVETPVVVPPPPVIRATAPVASDSAPRPEPKTVATPIQIDAPKPQTIIPPEVRPADNKTLILRESKPPKITETAIPQPAVAAAKPVTPPTILVAEPKTGVAKDPTPIATTVASTPATPSLSPGLIAGVALLAVAGWIGIVLFRRSRPAAPSFISRSMDDKD